MNINPYKLIAPVFWDVLDDVLADKHTHYWLKGGRASTKSSFVGITIPLCIMLDEANGIESNAVVMRKVGDTLFDSVYQQILWGINMLGCESSWTAKQNPLRLIYRGTHEILFRSSKDSDDYKKIKSIKFARGFCKYVWFEELDEFSGMEEIRQIIYSLFRGGCNYKAFYTYNPPKSVNSWVNAESIVLRDDKIVHSSTYLDVPKEWLGEQLLIEAEELKKTNELAYRNEFLGEMTGTGGAVFSNVLLEKISKEQRKTFDNILDGIDFGYAVDPSCYLQMHYDKGRKKLYIFNEIYKVGMSNKELANQIKHIKVGKSYITCDSAEPKSIDELKSLGLRTRGAKKGPDSIEFGIKFLQKLDKIIIDPETCPNASREFTMYEYEKDKYGNFKSKYPDINNHAIDCTRYAIEDYTRSNTWMLSKRKLF